MNYINTLLTGVRRIAGEIAAMRMAATGAIPAYTLDSSKVDISLAREIYENTSDRYKLGAWAAPAVVDTPAAFMGAPVLKTTDPDAQAVLDVFLERNASKVLAAHTGALRDGDYYIMPIVGEDDLDDEGRPIIGIQTIDAKMVSDIFINPFTGEEVKYRLKTAMEWQDPDGTKRKCTAVQDISAQETATTIDGDRPDGLEPGSVANKIDRLTISHFKNGGSSGIYGKSELERIEPYIKAYHDVMLQALQGHKVHATPRLVMKVSDVGAFLRNNFGVEDPVAWAKAGGTIKLDKDAIFLRNDETAEYLIASGADGGTDSLLKLLFYCIVDASQTPEFAFGVHTPSALASVKEQMPVLIRRVQKKRGTFEEAWGHLAETVLRLYSAATAKKFKSYRVAVMWDEIDPRGDDEIAAVISTMASGLSTAVTAGIISIESAANYFKKFIDTMEEYLSDDAEIPGERDRIIRDRLLKSRIDDGDIGEGEELAAIARAQAALDKELATKTAPAPKLVAKGGKAV